MQVKGFPITQIKCLFTVVVLGCVIGWMVVALPTPDVIGITALAVFSMVWLWFVYRQSHTGLRRVLVVAFILRAALAVVHLYVVPLPDSGADAAAFERLGWEWAQRWAAGTPFQLSFGGFFYAQVIGVMYFIVDRSPLLIQALNVFLGALTVYVTAAITRELFNPRVAVFSAWVVCLFPTQLLYSAITMREIITAFPLALAVLYFVRWLKTDRVYLLLVSMVCILISGLFHSGMTVLLVVPLAFWFYRSIAVFLRMRMGSFAIKILIGILIIGVFALPLATGVGLEKIGDASRLLDSGYLSERHGVQSRDRAAYLTGLTVTSPVDLVYFVPLKAVHFLFAPFPWQIREPIDLVGAFDGLFYLGLTVSAFYGFSEVRRRHGKLAAWGVAAVMLVGIAVFAMGSGNYGTALRHRGKFAFLFIAVAGPVLYHLWYRSIGRVRVGRYLRYDNVAQVSPKSDQ